MLQNLNAWLRGYTCFWVTVTYFNGFKARRCFYWYEDAKNYLKTVPDIYSVSLAGEHLFKGTVFFYLRERSDIEITWNADSRF